MIRGGADGGRGEAKRGVEGRLRYAQHVMVWVGESTKDTSTLGSGLQALASL